ncbi:TRAP transporter large permease [Microbacterium sp. No. 7]|uniref:TRAP transporter large permease n=1 Tax=Microbacterium sp. No. 7 TaxID=1714373 RepID=UPI0006D11F4F|nr:TRAP transporter large permease [Microbacterium sp. No. 7]ALJ22099.1 hypothetical protein AOA12_20310 [Microbacterium sp. No. 7]
MIILLVSVALMIVLIVIGFDVALSMIGSTLVYFALKMLLQGADQFTVVPQLMADQLRSDALVSVPLFILMGALMTVSGITTTLVRLLLYPFARLRGPLGYVNVAANLGMSGMSGSSVADAAATSMVLIRPMVKTGWRPAEAGALTAAAATIGPITPPSIPLVLIGGLASLSIGQLFLAGIVPGIAVAVGLMIWVYIRSRSRPRVDAHKVFATARVGAGRALLQALVAVATPLVVVGGLVSGATTTTEAAALGCAVSFLALFTVFRPPTGRALWESFREAALSTSAILITLAGSAGISWMLALEGVGDHLAVGLEALSFSPVLLWLTIIAGLLVLGLVLEAVPLIFILVPVVYPLLPALGIDPIHFSIVMTVALMIGAISPPVGLNLFAVSRTGDVPLDDLLRASWPYVGVLGIVTVILALVPQISLWLPGVFFPPS